MTTEFDDTLRNVGWHVGQNTTGSSLVVPLPVKSAGNSMQVDTNSQSEMKLIMGIGFLEKA